MLYPMECVLIVNKAKEMTSQVFVTVVYKIQLILLSDSAYSEVMVKTKRHV